jgi:hypothetical protein
MGRALRDCCRQSERAIASNGGVSVDGCQAGAAGGEGAGFVEHDGADPRQALQCAATFDHDTKSGGAADAGDEGDRGPLEGRDRGDARTVRLGLVGLDRADASVPGELIRRVKNLWQNKNKYGTSATHRPWPLSVGCVAKET